MQSCILCLEEGENLKQLNHCGVYYIHKKCYSKWNSKNNTCIVCREPLVNEHTIVIPQLQVHQQVHQQTQESVEENYNYTIINRIQFKMVYTINVMLIILITVLIFYIW
jgi:hypothetical protein